VGKCNPPSAYLVVCAKLRPFGAFQFSPKLPLDKARRRLNHLQQLQRADQRRAQLQQRGSLT